MGYFPTYSLGNIYAAQLFNAYQKNNPADVQMEGGDLHPLREWLRSHIHQYGRQYNPKMLIEKATGKAPNSKYLIEYLNAKYSELYKL